MVEWAKAEARPFRLAVHDNLVSTNDEAMAQLRGGDPGGLFVVATRQSDGRGRQGRSWASPPGNLYATLALLDPSPVAVAPQLGFVAGVALASALRIRLGGDDRLRIKWPNDMVFAGAKLAGILLESSVLPNGRLACVIGFGVNCRSHPQGLPYPAMDLHEAGDSDADPSGVLEALALELARRLSLWDRGANFAAIRAAWLARAVGLGERIIVSLPRHTLRGTFRDIDGDGQLILETETGRIKVAAGDVFLVGGAAGAMQALS